MLIVVLCVMFVMLFLLFLHLTVNMLNFRCLMAVTKGNTASDPLVSLLVPARNEEVHIEECVRSLLGQDYVRLEVLVLDDRSCDGTAAIVQGLIDALPEKQTCRLRLLHGAPLPMGWVGKNFACAQLAHFAHGDFLFFTDADTVHAPGTVRAVIECMHSLNVDLLTAQAEYRLKGLGERLVMPLLYFRVFTLLPLTLISCRHEPVLAAGNGPLLCFRRQAYNATGGHRAIKGRILEDVALARAVKAAGYRMAFVDARDMISCYMYASFSQTWTGFSKTFFAFYNYSLIAALVILIFDLALFVLPPLLLVLALWITFPLMVVLFALASYALAVLMRGLLALRFTRSQRLLTLLLCFLHPLSILLSCAILLNAMYWYYRKQGTEWKGRYYSV